MSSNFSYLNKDSKYKEISIACIEAERAFLASHSAAALQIRRALEIAVKWAYRYDADLTVPYQDNLSSLIHDPEFKEILDPKLFPRIKFIIIPIGQNSCRVTEFLLQHSLRATG